MKSKWSQERKSVICTAQTCRVLKKNSIKNVNLPPHSSPRKKRGGGGGWGGWGRGRGHACHCLHSDTTVLSDSYTVVPPFVERKPVVSGDGGVTVDAEIKVFQI